MAQSNANENENPNVVGTYSLNESSNSKTKCPNQKQLISHRSFRSGGNSVNSTVKKQVAPIKYQQLMNKKDEGNESSKTEKNQENDK